MFEPVMLSLLIAASIHASARHASHPVTIQMVDAHGKPLANREVWLVPTESTKNVRPIGYQWWIPDDQGALKGKTNAQGSVTIKYLKDKTPYMVITKFGPRFDPYIHRKYPSHTTSMDVIKLDGAVYAGKPAKVIVANDYQITGRVTDFETGKPVQGVEIELSDTLMGHMSGYPRTDLEKTKTDVNGQYAFRNLPNCFFSLDPTYVEHRGIERRYRPIDQWDSQQSTVANMRMDQPLRTCDFRISRMGSLDVTVVKGKAKSFEGWTMWIESIRGKKRDSVTGLQLGFAAKYNPERAKKGQEGRKFELIPGTYSIVMDRNNGRTRVEVSKVTLHSGESRTIEVAVPVAGK